METVFKLLRTLGRPVLLAIIYSAIFSASLWLSYQLRFDFVMPEFYTTQFLLALPWILPLKVLSLGLFGLFDSLLSYFSTPDLKHIFSAVITSSALILTVWVIVWAVQGVTVVPPRGVILSDFVLSIAGICATRLALRFLRERYLVPKRQPSAQARRVAIVGAGDVGASLARELLSKRWLAMNPVAFFDDFKSAFKSVHGIPLAGPPEALVDPNLDLSRKLRIQEVIIAMPSAPAKRIGEVVRILQQTGLKMRTVPSMAQLATGQVKASTLRAVEIQDLLGRATVEIDSGNIQSILAGRVVMVTGAGGSIGAELCRQIASFGPKEILLVERSEPQLFFIEQELIENGCGAAITPLVADILDTFRMERIFRRYAPDIVFHAAAHKHVPMMERQPAQALKNNVIATARLAELALRHKVSRFVLISTDKAINPTSVMGASKRLAEIFLQALHSSSNQGTKFIAVRFGNVLGSSGSVVPIFSRQIALGGPVKVTHREVTRYFMTIPEAARLVLQSAAQGQGGEIFVLDMGRPVKIWDLARQMIELSGLRPHIDIEIVITGLRPGEKLYEELSHMGENLTATDHPKILRFISKPPPLAFVRSVINEFVICLDAAEPEQIKAMLKAVIPEYSPYANKDGPNASSILESNRIAAPAPPVRPTAREVEAWRRIFHNSRYAARSRARIDSSQRIRPNRVRLEDDQRSPRTDDRDREH